MTLENMEDLTLQANDNGNKRKTIRYKANIEKNIYEVSHFIAIFSAENLKDGNNVEKTLSWKNDQGTKLDQFESNLENVDKWLKSKSKTTLMLEQEENVSQTHK